MGTDPITDQIPDPPSTGVQVDRGVPSDNTTLVAVLHRYEERGYTGQFGVTERGDLRCFSCGATSVPEQVEAASLRRMEGASDPDDSIAIVALHCPRCAVRGTITLGYGPDSAAEESELLLRLEDLRGLEDPGLPSDAAPGETVEINGGGR